MKCTCYTTYKNCFGPLRGVCMGTKEMEECYCGGDKTKCDFYHNKRENSKKKLNILESINDVIENGFEFSMSKDRIFEDFIWVSVRDPKTRFTIKKAIRCVNNAFFDYEAVMVEMIESMVAELKGEKYAN